MVAVLDLIDKTNAERPTEILYLQHQSAIAARLENKTEAWRLERDEIEKLFPGITAEADAQRGRK